MSLRWIPLLLLFAVPSWAQTPTPAPTVAAQDCCQAGAAGVPGCNDLSCELCVCNGVGATGGTADPACCTTDPGWDYQCSLEAQNNLYFVQCNCACAGQPTPTPTPAPSPVPIGANQCCHPSDPTTANALCAGTCPGGWVLQNNCACVVVP